MKEITEIEKLFYDEEEDFDSFNEPAVRIFFKDGEIIEGFISEENVFQPKNGDEFWNFEELCEHAKGFERKE